MKLAFIYPPYQGSANQPSIELVSKNYGVYPPINLGYVAAVARHHGHEISFIDANAEGLTKEETLERLKRIKPDAILFTITTYIFHQTLAWIKYFKHNLDAITIVGGVHTRAYPRETLSHKDIDFIIIGDCENTLPELLRRLEMNQGLRKVKNIGFRKGGKIIITGSGEYCDLIPGVYAARDLMPNQKYYSFISQKKNYTGILSNKGCPFKCNYCEQGANNHNSARSIPDFINEIKECYRKHEIREFDFFDPIFTLDKKRALAICGSIKRLDLDIEYAIRTRPDCVDDELLKSLKESGCKRIYYGIESSDENVLRNINKKINIGAAKEAIEKTRKNGIDAFGFFMFGCPGDTLKTVRETARYSRTAGLDYVQYNNFVALAGTKIYEDLVKKTKKDFWAAYTLQEKEPDWKLPRLGTKLTDKEIEREIIRAYVRFYFRPSQTILRLRKIKSFAELKKYAVASSGFIRACLSKR
ncbi:MAG: radical SAM protein [archaeon]